MYTLYCSKHKPINSSQQCTNITAIYCTFDFAK